jgi:hypothetical protein
MKLVVVFIYYEYEFGKIENKKQWAYRVFPYITVSVRLSTLFRIVATFSSSVATFYDLLAYYDCTTQYTCHVTQSCPFIAT